MAISSPSILSNIHKNLHKIDFKFKIWTIAKIQLKKERNPNNRFKEGRQNQIKEKRLSQWPRWVSERYAQGPGIAFNASGYRYVASAHQK